MKEDAHPLNWLIIIIVNNSPKDLLNYKFEYNIDFINITKVIKVYTYLCKYNLKKTSTKEQKQEWLNILYTIWEKGVATTTSSTNTSAIGQLKWFTTIDDFAGVQGMRFVQVLRWMRLYTNRRAGWDRERPDKEDTLTEGRTLYRLAPQW